MTKSLTNSFREKLVDSVSSLSQDSLYRSVRTIFKKSYHPVFVSSLDLHRIRNGLITEEKVKSYNKVLIIEKGVYDYEYFNMFFLANVVSLCIKAVCEGYIPQIDIVNSNSVNIWESFFEQPFPSIDRKNKKTVIATDRIGESLPSWHASYDEEEAEYWYTAYSMFVNLNSTCREYVQNEINTLLADRNVLGILCRGTDYTATKPKGHPIQPNIEEYFPIIDRLLEKNNYHHIYLATEDSRYEKVFRNKYHDLILTNKRTYYDEIYLKNNYELLSQVHFERENDEYIKGLEYISSLFILSRCNGLVAGNCGGTLGAILLNNGHYNDKYIFDLGLY